MPQFEKYPGESPVAANKRIAQNKAKARAKRNPDAVKTKSDMMANIMPTVKNIGY